MALDVEIASGTQSGSSSVPPSLRVSSGTPAMRSPIRSRSSSTPGPPAPNETTLQVWPAIQAHSRSRIALSSGLSGMAAGSLMRRWSHHRRTGG